MSCIRKKTFITALLLLLTAALPIVLTACNLDGVTEKYVVTGEEAALDEYSGGSQVLTYDVKDEFEGKPVTELKYFSLSNNEYLEKISIGANVKTISVWAFSNCKKLKAIEVSPDNQYFASLDGVLYTKDMKTLLVYPNSSHGVSYGTAGEYVSYGNFEMPDSVTAVADNAFYRCGGLQVVTLSDNLVTLGNRAFFRCDSLKVITLPDGLTTIGEDCFSQCTAKDFLSLYIPASVTSVGSYAFYNSSIKTISFGGQEANVTLADKAIPSSVTVQWQQGRA